MKKTLLSFLYISLLSVPVYCIAEESPSQMLPCHYTPLNTIQIELKSEQWVKTSTARVIVTVNATLKSNGLANLRQHVFGNLKRLNQDAEWFITTFNRSQDSSGLEHVYIQAETRLPEKAISNLRESAKSASSPGEKYEIYDIQFSPTQTEIQNAQTDLRKILYGKVKDEISSINQMYPTQHYQIHRLTLSLDSRLPTPAPTNNYMMRASAPMGDGMEGGNLSVSNKITMFAFVELASHMDDIRK